MGWKIGKIFPQCLNVCLLENGSKEGRILKLLVEIKLDCPLLRGSMITMGAEKYWVDFRYKQLPVFCFYCGTCGHQERSCIRKMDDAKEGIILEDQYGDWIRGSGATGGRKGGLGESKLRNQSREQGKGNREEVSAGEFRLVPATENSEHGIDGVDIVKLTMLQNEGTTKLTRRSPSSPSLETGDARSSVTDPKMITPENFKLPYDLVEKERASVSHVDIRTLEQREIERVGDDQMEVEGTQPVTNQARVSLGPLDQNIVRELIDEKVANTKTGK